MKKKLDLLFVAVVCLSTMSCNNVINQSVTEPMALDDIKKTIEQFEDFGNVYDRIFYVMSYLSPAEKAEFVTLTYGDYYHFQKEITEKDAKWNDDAIEEWQKKHGWKVAHVDSVYYYWKQRRKEYLENHKLIIEPVAYSMVPEGFFGREIPAVSIKVTSKRGEIDYLHAVFAIENKNIDNFDNILNYYYSIGLGGHNDIYIEEPVKEIVLEPKTFRVMGDYFESEDFAKMSFEELKEKYKFDFKVCSYDLTEEAIAAEKKNLPIPEWAERKLEYNEDINYSEYSISFYENAIGKELNETFESLEKYKQSIITDNMLRINAKAYKLHQLINRH